MPALRRLSPLLWLGPAIALIGLVVLWPVVVMVQSSFQNISGIGFVAGYNGTANFRQLFNEPDFVSVLVRTVIWVVVVVSITVLISLGLAQLFNQRFPGRRVARWALIIPWAASRTSCGIVCSPASSAYVVKGIDTKTATTIIQASAATGRPSQSA